MSKSTALIAGVTGISGQNLARLLTAPQNEKDWTVYGLSRTAADLPGVQAVAADLLDPTALKQTLSGKAITHVFFTSWMKMASEEENCEVNGAILKNLLDALADHPVKHVALVTGGKNYFGSFSESGKYPVVTPYREEQARKPGLNFYYTQEDILFAAAKERGFSWSVHRPNTVIGYAVNNLMNMGVTLAAYATICKETGAPFVFPGSPTIYRGVCDFTDARMLASQLHWAATTEAAQNQAFNIVNGDVFRWDWMWQQIADYFGLPVGEYPDKAIPLEERMAGKEAAWDGIVAKYGLQKTDLNKLASWWHTDSDLSRPFETFADMSKSRKLGYLEYKKSSESFTELFDQLREAKIIP